MYHVSKNCVLVLKFRTSIINVHRTKDIVVARLEEGKMAGKGKEYMSYDEYLVKVKEGIVTQDGNCPVTPLLVMLQGRWKSQLMYEMCIYDTVRFGQLKKDLPGITNTMLTKSLRELEEDGLVHREQFNEIPPHVEYSLTEMGRDLLPVFYSIMNWGFKYEKELYGKVEDR